MSPHQQGASQSCIKTPHRPHRHDAFWPPPLLHPEVDMLGVCIRYLPFSVIPGTYNYCPYQSFSQVNPAPSLSQIHPRVDLLSTPWLPAEIPFPSGGPCDYKSQSSSANASSTQLLSGSPRRRHSGFAAVYLTSTSSLQSLPIRDTLLLL